MLRVRQSRSNWSSTLTLLPRGRRESDRKASGGEAIFENREAVVAPEGFVFEDEEWDAEDVIVRRFVLGALVG